MNSYDSLVKVLSVIETGKFDMLSISALAREAYLSASHLQRLFRLTCGQSLMGYARGRKLAHSLDDLFFSDLRIIDIAATYGFQHEQSYIRAFNKEYGCSPGEARHDKIILPIRKRIAQEDLTNLKQGLLYGPEIVKVPSFHVIGKPISFRVFDVSKDAFITSQAGIKFCSDAVTLTSNAKHTDVYFGICTQLPGGLGNIEYMPCIQVKDLSDIPNGYTGRTIPSLLCARFRYIGNHRPEDISMMTAQETYDAKLRFLNSQSRYIACNDIRHIERIDSRLYDGTYCQMELIAPVKDTLK